MKKQGIIIIGSVAGGVLIAAVLIWLGWLFQVEGRAYQCNDSVLPFAWFETDMAHHRQAGDVLSPGWTWGGVERLGRAYQIGFYCIWGGATALLLVMLVKLQKRQIENSRR